MTLLYRRLLTSLIPFVFGYSASLLQRQPSPTSNQNSWLDSFGLGSNYFAFLFMMITLETLIQIAQQMKASRNNLNTETIIPRPSSFEKQRKDLKCTLKDLFHAIVSFTLIFLVYQAIGLWILSFLNNRNSPHLTIVKEEQSSNDLGYQEEIININLQDKDFLTTSRRILEESTLENQQQKELFSSKLASQIVQEETISFSMGYLRSQLNLRLNAITVTKDQKIVFAADFWNSLKVLDISDAKSPRIIGEIACFMDSPYMYLPQRSDILALTLSADEKILFISNYIQLMAVNVTNPKAPEQIFGTNFDYSFSFMGFDSSKRYKTSLEIDKSGEILFIGGQGFLAYNISNPKQPTLFKNFTTIWSPLLDKNFHANEIKLSADKRFLLQADKDLKIYNVSDPKDIRLIASLETPCSAGSLIFKSDPNKLLLLGGSAEKGIKIDEVDISNCSSPYIIKSYQFDYKIAQIPHFIASSPGQTRYYISGFAVRGERSGLFTFDDLTKTVTINPDILIRDVDQLEFVQDGRFVVIASRSGFRAIELLKNFPNSQIYESTTRKLNSFTLSNDDDWEIEIFPDGKTMFLAHRSRRAPYAASLEIWEVNSPNVPYKLSSLDVTESLKGAKWGFQFYGVAFASNYKTAYLMFREGILFVDISDRLSPKIIKCFKNDIDAELENIQKLLMTSGGKNGVGLMFKSAGTFGFSEASGQMERFWTSNKTSNQNGGFKALLKDDDTLILVGRELTIYNISDIQHPVEIASVAINQNEIMPIINEVQLATNKNLLYVQVFDGTYKPFRLQIYNVSDLSSPQLMAEHTFFQTDFSGYADKYKLIRFTSDFKTGYMYQNGSLLKIQLSDEKISGVIPHYNNIDDKIWGFLLSPDDHTIYARKKSDDKTINIISAHSNHTLFLQKERFALGERYSENLKILRLNTMFNYDLISDQESYKMLKLSLLEVRVDQDKLSPDFIESSLPSWIQFSHSHNLITFEPKYRSDLGKFTLQCSVAFRIPDNAFAGLGVDSEDLLVWLTALNYVDNQLFLAENFVSLESAYASGGGLGSFRLPKEFRPYKERIFNILRKFYVKVGTTFEIIPSLESSKNLVISTPHPENIKVNIDLIPSPESQAQFLHKSYAPLSSVFIENKPKPRLQFEGALKDINAALQSIVVDFEKDKDFDANFTINDGFNRPLTMSLANVSKLFMLNKPPEINNRSIQQQIDLHDIYTGQHFTIDLDQNTFKDEFVDTLTYELRMAKDNIERPEWLSLTGLKLQGNPPEEILQDIDLVIIAKNEFKETREPFRMKVKISLVFYLKSALKYGSYVVSIVGLIISLNKIFNILGKGYYKHPQEFKLSSGEKITSEVIPPIFFVLKEKQEADLIINHLKRFVSRDLKQKSAKFLDYFIDSVSKQLDKQKVFDVIEEIFERLPVKEKEELSYYCSVENSRKTLIQQLIIDQIILWQLADDKKTKSIFNSIKKKWVEMVRWDTSLSKFVLNQGKFDKIVQEKLPPQLCQKGSLLGDSTLEIINDNSTLLVPGVNMGLLQDAILAYAFADHQINRLPVKAKVTMKEQIKTNFLKRFFKRDLKSTHKINYGIDYEITDDILNFSGVTKRNLEGRTLVIQIETTRERILKEIWIHGTPLSISRMNQELGDNYEIY